MVQSFERMFIFIIWSRERENYDCNTFCIIELFLFSSNCGFFSDSRVFQKKNYCVLSIYLLLYISY